MLFLRGKNFRLYINIHYGIVFLIPKTKNPKNAKNFKKIKPKNDGNNLISKYGKVLKYIPPVFFNGFNIPEN